MINIFAEMVSLFIKIVTVFIKTVAAFIMDLESNLVHFLVTPLEKLTLFIRLQGVLINLKVIHRHRFFPKLTQLGRWIKFSHLSMLLE